MSEYLVWKIENRFNDSIFVQIAEVDIVYHAHSRFLLLSIHHSPHLHLNNRTDVLLIGEVPRRSVHAIHQTICSVLFNIDKVKHVVIEITHRQRFAAHRPFQSTQHDLIQLDHLLICGILDHLQILLVSHPCYILDSLFSLYSSQMLL